jgi:hypothetical protein
MSTATGFKGALQEWWEGLYVSAGIKPKKLKMLAVFVGFILFIVVAKACGG